jgi:DNA-binding MarR family transcriptional regulator
LEQAGYLQRKPDPQDGRKQILCPSMERVQAIRQVFDPIREDATALLERFDTHQLTAIADFLIHSTDFAYRHAALLRSDPPHRADLANSTGTTERDQ